MVVWIRLYILVIYPQEVQKKYDLCFVASQPENECKNIKWVYKNCPDYYSVLQLGLKPSIKYPKNVKCKWVPKGEMAKYICQCKVAIVPNKEDDSGPRVIPEFMACGIPTIILDSVRFNKEAYGIEAYDKKQFWPKVSYWLNCNSYEAESKRLVKFYDENLSMIYAARNLRSIIEKHRFRGKV